MIRKNVVKIILSILIGLLVTTLTFFVNQSSNAPCLNGADTCLRDYHYIGYPFTMATQIFGVIEFDYYSALLNLLFWITASAVIIMVIIPFLKENIQKRK